MKKTTIPNKVTLGFTTVTIKLLDTHISKDIGEQYGSYINSVPYTIYLDRTIIERGGPDALNLVIHEFLHHTHHMHELDNNTTEELLVNTYANDITELLVRSELKDWILEQLGASVRGIKGLVVNKH
tara:strand:+ start:811 stop:1191 length:381 start_codon:yes stop_codon:yes gene_type:complete